MPSIHGADVGDVADRKVVWSRGLEVLLLAALHSLGLLLRRESTPVLGGGGLHGPFGGQGVTLADASKKPGQALVVMNPASKSLIQGLD